MKRFAFLALILIAIIALFGQLGAGSLYWDEAIYAQVSKEMLERGDWLTPHWNGRVLFHKPPIYFWATAGLFRLFGYSEFASRVPSAVSGLGVILISYLIARRLLSVSAAILAVSILLTTQLFVFYARFGTTDTALSFLILLAVYGYIRSEKDNRFWVLTGAACGAALMVKGAAGLVAPGTVIVTSLLQNRVRVALKSRWLWLGIALAALIVLPWHLAMFWLHGNAFLKGYFVQQLVNRATTDLHDYRRGYGYYIWVLWDFFSPWFCLLPFALVLSRKRPVILMVLAAIVLVLYTVVQTKFQWYVLPAIPALAILIAGFLTNLLERTGWQRTLTAVAIAVMVLGGSYGVLKQLSMQRPEIEAAANLAKLSSRDEGAIAAYPENLEMTVKYYSGRKLCADPVLSPLSYNERTACSPGQQTHMILKKAERAKVEGRFHIVPFLENRDLIYAAVLRRY